MRIRELKLKDAPFMLEWMHDESILDSARWKFQEENLKNCESFILSTKNSEFEKHFAIVSDSDEYMGTVSLKSIDRINNSAELFLFVRKCAMSKGYAWYGMEEVIKWAFEKYNLEIVYWCVSEKNERAVRFCDKHNFHEAVDISEAIIERYREWNNLKWYSVLRGDIFDDRIEVAGCKIVHIKTIPTVGAGELSFFEATHDFPFEVKRMYYISKVPEGVRRGFHAHKKLKQFLFCPYGRIQLVLENTKGREEIELSDPSIGVMIEEPTWREMLWLQKDSVLCVAASDFYEVEDYIRDYDDFKKYIEGENFLTQPLTLEQRRLDYNE